MFPLTSNKECGLPVCHQVSTTGQRPSPTTVWYHSQASVLMGSPTAHRRGCYGSLQSPWCRVTHRDGESDHTRAQSFQGGAVVLLHPLVSVLQQQADRSGGPVKLVDLQSLDHLPVPSCGQTQRVRAAIVVSVTENCPSVTGTNTISSAGSNFRPDAQL